MTLSAKALFDNLADAPDELTFRKGDIVTVIERDVDGLIGWWLCLLHGRQGIVPGNRLQVIPPVELDQFEKETKKRGSYETDEFLDGVDVLDGAGHNYDRLPSPTKAQNNSSYPPLSIKDMFNIPYKKEAEAVVFYDIPKVQNEEIYDTPKNQDIQDNNKQSKPQNNGYKPVASDASNFDEVYDVPKQNSGYKVPNIVNNSVNDNELYDIPKNNNELDVDALMGEIYDSPFSTETNTGTIKCSPLSSNTSTPRNSMTCRHSAETLSQKLGDEIYDIPCQPSNEIYDIPSESKEILSDDVVGTPKYANSTEHLETEFYDTPKSQLSASDTYRTVLQEVYDIPSSQTLKKNVTKETPENNLPLFKTLPRTFSPKTNNNATGIKSTRLQEIYDTPSTTLNRHSANSSPAGTPLMTRKTISQQEIYDVPSTIPQEIYNTPMSKPQEIYDTPPIKLHEIHDTPPVKSQEIYDTPPLRPQDKISNVSGRGSFITVQEKVYDVPTSNTLKRNHSLNVQEVEASANADDIYDIPANHNLNQVMSDVTSAYTSHKRNNQAGNNLSLRVGGEDEYVDYQDIWTKEPPKHLVREHAKSLSSNDIPFPHSPSPTAAQKRLSSEHRKSILDQINFEAVKELEMTTGDAMERLRKLHLAVDTCVTTMMSFCGDNWLDVSVLLTTLPSIRDFSSKLKTALRLLTEFGLGTLVNTTKSINGEILMDKLIGDVEPLLESYYKIKICLMHLDGNNWLVPQERSSSNEKFFATLNAIMILAQRIPDQCRAFSLSVQNSVNELFSPDPVAEITQQLHKVSMPKEQPKMQILKEPEMSAEELRRELAGRRQQARDTSTLRPVPRIPPKPTLPNQRKYLAGAIDPPESPRWNSESRGYGDIERLVTDFVPENTRQKKYASDPTTPSHTDKNPTMWGGSCPVLLDRNSAAAASPIRGDESTSSSSSVGASIPEEEMIEVRRRTEQTNERLSKNYPSDSNLRSPVLTPMHMRSASLPYDDKLKNSFAYDDVGMKSPPLSPLDHRDIEALEFFCRQVESQVMLLRESMKNLTEAVENREEPSVFVSHSKFVILTAHKVVHGGQEISARLLNEDIKTKLKNGTAHLTICIRGVVASTKTAALEYPEAMALMEMISSVLAIGDAVRIIHSECRRALDA